VVVTIAQQGTHTLAIIAALQTAGLNVGDGSGEGVPFPKAVVYDVSDRTHGTLGDPNENTEFVYQVTCVGRVPAEARYVRDKAMLLLNGFTVSGRSIVRVFKEDGSGGIQREDDALVIDGKKVTLFYCTPRFRVLSVPA
jgi:hypothetical protein